MDDIEFYFMGWQYDKKANTDKMWTAFKVQGCYYAAWGRRGKAIRFKQHASYSSLEKVMLKKQKDYDDIDPLELFTMFPGFEEEVASQLSFSILADKVM